MTRATPTRDVIVDLLRHFEDGMTITELAQETGRNHTTMARVIHNWRSKTGSDIFRIAGWEPCRDRGGKHQPVFVLGPGPDAKLKKLPTDESRKESKRRYYQRKRVVIMAKQRTLRYGIAPSPWAGLL